MRYSILFILLITSTQIYAQGNFSLAPNGVTITCTGANSGAKGVVSGVTYTAVDRDLLITKLDAGEDLSKVCTSPVTDMTSMFSTQRFI